MSNILQIRKQWTALPNFEEKSFGPMKVQHINSKVHIFWEATKFCKSPPYFWLALHRIKVRWRFRKILWPSQNIWTLTYWKSVLEMYPERMYSSTYAPFLGPLLLALGSNIASLAIWCGVNAAWNEEIARKEGAELSGPGAWGGGSHSRPDHPKM